MIEIECSAFFAAMNPKILTGSRCPWQRRPPLFSGCRAPQRGSDSRAATDAAPHARPRSGPQPHRSRPRPGATSSAVTAPSTPAHAPAAGSAGHWSATSGPPQPGTPSNTAVSLASTDILSARPDGPAIRCPRNRGNSRRSEGLVAGEHVPDRLGELAREVDLGDLGAALAAEALLHRLVALGVDGVAAGVQRGLEQRPAQVARALFGDRTAPVDGAGLIDA